MLRNFSLILLALFSISSLPSFANHTLPPERGGFLKLSNIDIYDSKNIFQLWLHQDLENSTIEISIKPRAAQMPLDESEIYLSIDEEDLRGSTIKFQMDNQGKEWGLYEFELNSSQSIPRDTYFLEINSETEGEKESLQQHLLRFPRKYHSIEQSSHKRTPSPRTFATHPSASTVGPKLPKHSTAKPDSLIIIDVLSKDARQRWDTKDLLVRLGKSRKICMQKNGDKIERHHIRLVSIDGQGNGLTLRSDGHDLTEIVADGPKDRLEFFLIKQKGCLTGQKYNLEIESFDKQDISVFKRKFRIEIMGHSYESNKTAKKHRKSFYENKEHFYQQ